jgi:transcriptional regulator with XRE-family HTH domain
MDGIGVKLRSARNQWGLTLREVEERSGVLSQQSNNPAYRISASWLDRIERENRGLSATKLIVLAHIYGLKTDQILALYPETNEPPTTQLAPVSSPNSTHLLLEGPLEEHARLLLPETLVTDPPPQDTTLLPPDKTVMPIHYRRGIIGQRDRTMDPMILPGSIVLIDTQKRAIGSRRDWTNEFNRPIYFLFTRTGYLCGFCDLDKLSEWLTLVPHMLSFETNKRLRYKHEVEVIGTVAGIFSRRLA